MVRERVFELINDSAKLNSLTIELLSGCNFKCVHCYVQDRVSTEKNHILPFETVKNILDQAEKMNVFALIFTGGEPLLHPDIHRILSIAKEKSFIVTLKTNASLINSENISFIKNSVSKITVSCYGFTRNSFENVTKVKGAYDKYLSAIELLQQHNINYEIRGILLKENQAEVEKFINSCSMVETYITDHVNSNYAASHRPDDDAIIKVIKSKFDKAIISNVSSNGRICNACNGSLTINCEGDINPCANFHLSMGNIYNDSLESVWNSDIKKAIIEHTQTKYFTQCEQCDKNKYNVKMAPCNNYEETGNMHICSSEACRQCELLKYVFEEL